MALGFGNKNQSQSATPDPQVSQEQSRDEQPYAQESEAETQEDADFLKQYAGAGLESIDSSAVSTPWISVMQDKTKHVVAGLCESGVWRNSASGMVYGKSLRVVPIAFKIIWNERDSDTGNTVANYEPGSIQLKIIPPKLGTRGYPKKLNPETDNKVDETYLYAVTLPAYPEEGVVFVQASMGSLGTFKRWNSQLRAQVLPDGTRAPLFAYEWELILGDTQAVNKNGQLYYKVENVKRGNLVSKQFFVQRIESNLQVALTTQMALTAPSDESDNAERIQE